MKSALEIIESNRALRKLEREKSGQKVKLESTQTVQQKIENAAMVSERFGTPMDEAQRAMGMTDEQIEEFRRN